MKNFAFVDGSFNQKTNRYGGGGILIDQHGCRHVIFNCWQNGKWARMRNVAGEICGTMEVVKKAKKLGMKKLKIFYDYEGIENWVTGKWSCNKDETRYYKKFMKNCIKEGLKITFQHVKAHTGIHENEEVDLLAKFVVGVRKGL